MLLALQALEEEEFDPVGLPLQSLGSTGLKGVGGLGFRVEGLEYPNP